MRTVGVLPQSGRPQEEVVSLLLPCTFQRESFWADIYFIWGLHCLSVPRFSYLAQGALLPLWIVPAVFVIARCRSLIRLQYLSGLISLIPRAPTWGFVLYSYDSGEQSCWPAMEFRSWTRAEPQGRSYCKSDDCATVDRRTAHHKHWIRTDRQFPSSHLLYLQNPGSRERDALFIGSRVNKPCPPSCPPKVTPIHQWIEAGWILFSAFRFHVAHLPPRAYAEGMFIPVTYSSESAVEFALKPSSSVLWIMTSQGRQGIVKCTYTDGILA